MQIAFIIKVWISVIFMLTWNVIAYAQSSESILSAEKIVLLIPDRIKDFHSSSDSQGKVVKLGDLQYAVAERNFSASRKRSIKVLLFDFKEAAIMYIQATRPWTSYSVVENDSLIRRPTFVHDGIGWESYDAKSGSSQVLIGVLDRYYLTVEGTNVDLIFLKNLIQEFKLEKFPK